MTVIGPSFCQRPSSRLLTVACISIYQVVTVSYERNHCLLYYITGLRLSDGNCSHTGRLEIFHAGRWGSICDLGFDDAEVQLACKQLGYKHGFLGTVESYWRPTPSPRRTVWLKGLNCGPEHVKLHECPHIGGWGSTGCDLNQDVFLTCSRKILPHEIPLRDTLQHVNDARNCSL